MCPDYSFSSVSSFIDISFCVYNIVVSDVSPAHVVDEKDNEIGFVRFCGYKWSKEEGECGESGLEAFHFVEREGFVLSKVTKKQLYQNKAALNYKLLHTRRFASEGPTLCLSIRL